MCIYIYIFMYVSIIYTYIYRCGCWALGYLVRRWDDFGFPGGFGWIDLDAFWSLFLDEPWHTHIILLVIYIYVHHYTYIYILIMSYCIHLTSNKMVDSDHVCWLDSHFTGERDDGFIKSGRTYFRQAHFSVMVEIWWFSHFVLVKSYYDPI